ncbi:response regulator transcription factor [Syntrophomonas erecta]
MAERILLVDDEVKILDMVDNYLSSEGYQIGRASTGLEALEVLSGNSYDLMVLDLMLPELSGLEVCKRIRQDSDIPIIMLTARGDEIDKLLGLELGADDYISKPFSLRELGARIKAVLRRSKPSPRNGISDTLLVENLRLELTRYELYIDNQPVSLTPTEFKLLGTLAINPGQVFSRLQLLEKVYGDIYQGYERSIDTHMSNIRKKLEKNGSHIVIKTVYGVGYKLEVEPE